MKRIGLTGGIGSGKSVVSKLLTVFGIPVYDSDEHSKRLCQTNEFLMEELKRLYGDEVYLEDGTLNRAFMAKALFANELLLKETNRIIHPVVAEDFIQWSEFQDAPFVVQESAILFEAGLAHLFDAVAVVTAPEDVRINRVCSRSHLTPEEVKMRMRQQLSENELIQRSQYHIINDGQRPLIPQVMGLINQLEGNESNNS